MAVLHFVVERERTGQDEERVWASALSLCVLLQSRFLSMK